MFVVLLGYFLHILKHINILGNGNNFLKAQYNCTSKSSPAATFCVFTTLTNSFILMKNCGCDDIFSLHQMQSYFCWIYNKTKRAIAAYFWVQVRLKAEARWIRKSTFFESRKDNIERYVWWLWRKHDFKSIADLWKKRLFRSQSTCSTRLTDIFALYSLKVTVSMYCYLHTTYTRTVNNTFFTRKRI